MKKTVPGKSAAFALIFTLVLTILLAPGVSLAEDSIPEAWGRIILQTPMANLPFGQLSGTTISLTASDGSYSRQISSGSDAVAAAFKKGKFSFSRVPTGKSLRFVLKVQGASGSDTYTSSYRFLYPELNVIQKFRKKKALEIAGYMGDFTVDVATGRISYSNQYD